MAELDLISTYLDDIGAIPRLTPEEEKVLLRAAHEGDPEARRRVIEANLRLVVAVARQYQHTPLPMGDLIQEGSLGLMRAAAGFDPAKGYRFSTFADESIRNAIIDALRKHKQDLSLDLSYGPAEACLDGGPSGSLGEKLADTKAELPDERAELRELQAAVTGRLELLPWPENSALRLFAEGYGAAEVRRVLDPEAELLLSEEGARHLKDVALRKLAHPALNQGLRAA